MHKHILSIFALGLLGGVMLAGCGSSATGGGNYSCDFKQGTTHVCAEYDNYPDVALSSYKSACTSEGGTAGSSCSSTSRVGTCTTTAGGYSVKTSYYSDGGFTAAMAMSACPSPGVFTSG